MAVAVPATPEFHTIEAFLAWEDTQPERYEWSLGRVRMMVGASAAHNEIAGALRMAMARRVPAACRAYGEAMRLRTRSGVFYPDVMVRCGPRDPAATGFEDPVLLAEVLSPGTQRIDREEKWDAYQTIPTLRQYLLVRQDAPVIECLTRTDGDAPWVFTRVAGVAATLPAIPALAGAAPIPLAEIFGDLFDGAETPPE